MAIQEISQAFNPITGVFGTGQVQVFGTSGSWTVPTGISKVRVRLWGAGGGTYGSGGGFSLKTIYDLTGVTSIAVTVGTAAGSATGGTSSFGSYCSATGGALNAGAVGAGSGGDINYSGGLGNATSFGGGGAASLFGNGGRAALSLTTNGFNGASGGGGPLGAAGAPLSGGNGFLGSGATFESLTTSYNLPTSGLLPIFSIDFIGTGGGGVHRFPGVNGGGGGGLTSSESSFGGFPGGGGGGSSGSSGGAGLVIVEW